MILRIDAPAIADGSGFSASPGSMLLSLPHPRDLWAPPPRRARRVLAVGLPADVARHPAHAGAVVARLPGSLLIPGLVNAHTHLDLTHIGPRPHDADAGFVPWIDMIRRDRLHHHAQIAASVRRGIDLSLAGGTAALGDIAGAPRGVPSLAPLAELRDSALLGVSFLEFFSRGKFRRQGLDAGLDTLRSGAPAAPASNNPILPPVRLGLQPHAPNTVCLSSYAAATAEACRLRAPLCTHLAETPEERRFIARADGPQRDLLESLGLWDDSANDDIGAGLHPVEFLAPVLDAAHQAGAPYLVAHVNDAPDQAIEILARTRAAVAYCPRASAYFGVDREFGPHRYRTMLDAGVPVALGTDSIVNLPTSASDGASGGISVWHEAQFLYRRDAADPTLLLRMATLNGARALGLPESLFRFDPLNESFLAGLVAISPETPCSDGDMLRFALNQPTRIQLLSDRNLFELAGIVPAA
ncbi:MAG: amidohydrolase family protein [Phycisphaerales bacterium]